MISKDEEALISSKVEIARLERFAGVLGEIENHFNGRAKTFSARYGYKSLVSFYGKALFALGRVQRLVSMELKSEKCRIESITAKPEDL